MVPEFIIFDLAEVLVKGLADIDVALSEKLKLPRNGLLDQVWFRIDELCEGRISEDEYVHSLLIKTGWKLKPTEFKKMLRANFEYEIPGASEILKDLVSRYRLILLSDHCREWISHIEGIHGFLKLLEKRYYSFQLGSLKSSPDTFQKLLIELKTSADRCIFIDDREVNITSAVSVGIAGIQFENAPQLRNRLHALGIMQPEGAGQIS